MGRLHAAHADPVVVQREKINIHRVVKFNYSY